MWFIASQDPLLPVLCVRCNRVVSFSRPVASDTTGVIEYRRRDVCNDSVTVDGMAGQCSGRSGERGASSRSSKR